MPRDGTRARPRSAMAAPSRRCSSASPTRRRRRTHRSHPTAAPTTRASFRGLSAPCRTSWERARRPSALRSTRRCGCCCRTCLAITPAAAIDEDLRDAFFALRSQLAESERIALIVDSPGGEGRSAYSLARLLQRHCDGWTAVVPRYAKSAATLLVMGADRIYMGRDAELGPLDAELADSSSRADQLGARGGAGARSGCAPRRSARSTRR